MIIEGSHLCSGLKSPSHSKSRGKLIEKLLKINEKIEEIMKNDQKQRKKSSGRAAASDED